MKDISGVMKVVERIDSDVKETNIQIDHQTKELKQLESRFENLTDRLAFLEQANIEKEGRIDYLEGVIQSMSDKLCRCGDCEVSSVLVEAVSRIAIASPDICRIIKRIMTIMHETYIHYQPQKYSRSLRELRYSARRL